MIMMVSDEMRPDYPITQNRACFIDFDNPSRPSDKV